MGKKKSVVRKVFWGLIGGGLLALTIAMLFFKPDITSCIAPEGFEVKTKTDAIEPKSGETIHIIRAIVSTGDPMLGSKKIVVPACGSNDRDITNVTNMPIQINGVYTYIASGAITYGSAPLAASTQP